MLDDYNLNALRKVAQSRTCLKCLWYRESSVEGILADCLYNPPILFQAIDPPGEERVGPSIFPAYPHIYPGDTCSHWTQELPVIRETP